MGAKMWLPDRDPFEPKATERSDAFAWIAMVLGALVLTLVIGASMDLVPQTFWHWSFVGVIMAFVFRPSGIAYFRNFFRWLRRM
jgi:hypothetical protein